MIKHNIIVVGTSAGGVQTLCELTKYLPEDFDASIFVVMAYRQRNHVARNLESSRKSSCCNCRTR